mgnify:CR=1 FL=1
MFLSEIFDQLTYGELAQVSIGGNGIGVIDPEDYRAIVSHINIGLTDLHTRLPLKQDSVIIQQYDYIQTYYLQYKFAQSNNASTESVKYIMDSALKPFRDNVLKVEQVFSEIGEEYVLNDGNQAFSVYTPQHDAVVIPFTDQNNILSVIFRANHERIVIGDGFNPGTTAISIPQYLVEPLITYVAARILTGMGSNYVNEAALLMSKYQLLVRQAETYGLVNSDTLSNEKLENNGWV